MLIECVTSGSVWVCDDADPALGCVFTWPVPQAPPPPRPHGWHGSPSVCGRSGPSPHCGARPAATDERFRNSVPKTPPTSPKLHIKSKATHYMCCHSVGEERDHHTLWFRDRTIKLLVWPLSAEYLSCQFSGRGRWGLWAGWVTMWDRFLLSESDLDEKGRLPAAHAETERRERDLQGLIKQE